MGRYDSELGTFLLVCNIMLVNGLLWSFVLQRAKEFLEISHMYFEDGGTELTMDCQCEPF